MVRRIAKRSAGMALWQKCVLSKRESLHGMDQVATLAKAGLDPAGYSRLFPGHIHASPGSLMSTTSGVGLFIRPLSTGRCRSVLSLIGYLPYVHTQPSQELLSATLNLHSLADNCGSPWGCSPRCKSSQNGKLYHDPGMVPIL